MASVFSRLNKHYPMSTQYIIVLVTTADKAEAEKIAKTLLNEKLIACANIVGSVTSFFAWKDKINCAEECLMIMKSQADLFELLEARVKSLHSYEVPEVLALPILAGSSGYLAWMNQILKTR